MLPRARFGLAALAAVALTACQSSPNCPPMGPCEPTVEGAPSGAYCDYEAARLAFTRSTKDGSLTATLEDVAWLRFEGEECTIVQKHRAYFEQGYTTFQLASFTKEFVQPTAEFFVLTDSAGSRATARPASYQSSLEQEKERFAARFTISFRHAITRDLAWVRLTRQADGSVLEWQFPSAGGPGGPAPMAEGGASCVPPPARCGCEGGARPQPQSLWSPRNPAPGPTDVQPGAPLGRPVNLATQPAATSSTRSAVPPPPEPAFPAPAASEVPPPPVPPSSVPPAAVPPASGVPPLGPPPSGPLPPPDSRRVSR